jgi:EmrB/QacA subfamily drug resistance transporter
LNNVQEPQMTDVPMPPTTGPPGLKPHVPLGLILLIAAVTQAMTILDSSIVNVALPDMKADLGLSVTGQQWVVDGYLIAFGGLMLLASRAGDVFGRREVFLAGITVFTLASVVGGLAQDGSVLIVARIVQGLGAAALAPSSLSLITSTHTEPAQRAKALTVWASAAAASSALGMVLGGILTELDWRLVMFINVPAGVALFAAAVRSLEPSRGGSGERLDVPGGVTVTVGVAALVYGVTHATSHGWGSAGVVVTLSAAAALLAAFLLIERRSASPLLPLGVFRDRSVSVSAVILACVGVPMTSVFFFLSLYQQQVLGYGALRTGLALAPMALMLVVGSVIAMKLEKRASPRALIVAGGVIAAGGLVWLGALPVEPAYAAHVLGPTLLAGLGIGVMALPVTHAATSTIAPELAGLSSGIVNVSRQLGAAIGISVLVTVAAAATRNSDAGAAAATVDGYGVAMLVCAGACVVAALIALLLPAPAAHPVGLATAGSDGAA